METLDLRQTALVLIDLQKGIVSSPTQPHPVDRVLANAAKLAEAFRTGGGTVVLVHVGFRDGRERLNPQADLANAMPQNLPSDWSEIVPELGPKEGDVMILKRQWGAFYGTDLDLQLRRRKVDTIVLAGIATNFGVESTARDAYERGYDQVFAEDATSSRSADGHRFTFENIFPRIGRARSTDEVLSMLSAS